MNKKIGIGLLTISLVGAGLFMTGHSYAQGVTNQESLVQMLADKFHLANADVQAVFDQHRSTHMAAMDTRIADRLSTLVKNGKITETQKTAILAKVKELQTNREATREKFETMSVEERRAARQQEQTNLQSWATANGINLSDIQPMLGKRGMMHMGE